MVPCRILYLGVDVLVSCRSRLIHNSSHTRDNFPNALYTMRFTDLKVLKLERKTASQRLTKNLHGIYNIVLLDSGFCVLQGLVDVKKEGCL